MDAALDASIRSRARRRCEYCQMPQSVRRLKFPIDHIIARKHGGLTSEDNLALACGHCNLHKGTDLSGIDPVANRMTRLFHPRRDRWPSHFKWEGTLIVGTTPIGRATVAVLQMNRESDLAIRDELLLRKMLTGDEDAPA